MSRASTQPTDYEPGTDPRRWRALVVTLAGGFMILLDVSIVTVAIPSIQEGLGTSEAGVQWVVSGYPLTFGLALVAGGLLGDAFGRRNMYLVALTAFIATSVFAGLAPSLTLLVVARLLQGLAAGLVTPQNGGLIQDLFRGAERGKAFGLFGATVGLSTAVGPVIGGFILGVAGEPDGWRWVFLVNLPFGLLTLVLAVLLVPRTPRRTTRADIDYAGILLLGLTVLAVMFPVVLSESGGLRRFWWLFLVAVPLGWSFLRWERRRRLADRPPLVDTRLFTATPGYPSGATLAAVYFCGFAGIWLVFAVYFQSDLGLTPLESGLAVTPFALGSAVSAWLAGRLVHRYGRRVTTAGLVLISAGLTMVAVLGFTVGKEHLIWAIAVPLLVAGIGGGAVISPNTTLTLACVPTSMSGVASGVLQTGQRIGSAVGTALLAAVFHAVATAYAPATGFAVAMIVAVALIVIALVLAIAEHRGQIGNHGNTELENFSSTSMTSSQ
ncbi:MFS transporter [Actinophytocola algeriensis]|uniref:EmrB/QacA subfamily drug resistance transporter n=1 Tax=Actinophytocola algeriensis TaxID=1768010 RepID=A0A7W7VJI3_9PSEU|nr:MFS transporter [Actinophytocola algeriensis]MBB4912374.1 EmrB/QacA subfamily drug resistance transporter [Actinophytocola algeriensis]MBE1481053.1 EmrB/QacA subfamily drug resistance transporter [Actinophytocola algeriensis]